MPTKLRLLLLLSPLAEGVNLLTDVSVTTLVLLWTEEGAGHAV